MGAATEADQLCRSIPGREMSRLHLDGILTQILIPDDDDDEDDDSDGAHIRTRTYVA